MGRIGKDDLLGFNISAYVGAPLKAAGNNDASAPRFVVQAAITF